MFLLVADSASAGCPAAEHWSKPAGCNRWPARRNQNRRGDLEKTGTSL